MISRKTNAYLAHLRKNYRKCIDRIKPYRQKFEERGHKKISAYMSIFNDDDFIVSVLRNIKNYVDELVIVDGAYEWMVPYLKELGVDPLRSRQELYDVVEACGIPYRVVSRVWPNEFEKRKAGYEECAYRYVMRVDADEILFFDDESLGGFWGSGCAVAEMQFPLYVVPGWVVGNFSRLKYPAQSLLFDKTKISASKHLEYLWLVTPADELPETDQKTYPIYERPVAFCAHLSVWRSMETAANRAAFYVSNWIRKNGIPWGRNGPVTQGIGFGDLFRFVPANEFKGAMQRSHVAFGLTTFSPKSRIVPSPLSCEQEAIFSSFYYSQCAELDELNRKVCNTVQPYIVGEPVYIDFTSDKAKSVLSRSDVIRLTTVAPGAEVNAALITIAVGDELVVKQNLTCQASNGVVSIDISPACKRLGILRQFIELRFSALEDEIYGHFQVLNPVGT